MNAKFDKLELWNRLGGRAKANKIGMVDLCSGADAPHVALSPLGFRTVVVAEIDKAASKVLAARVKAENVRDILAHDFRAHLASSAVMVGGPPCQDFSHNGKRKGVGGEKGQLSLRYAAALHEAQPLVALMENVPGMLSSKKSELDGMGSVLAAIAFGPECVPLNSPVMPPAQFETVSKDGTINRKHGLAGYVQGPLYRVAWIVLDSRHYGVAQGRERLFVVSCPAGGPDPRDIILQKTALGEGRAWDDIMENSSGHPATRNGEAVGWEFEKEPRQPLFLVRSRPADAVPACKMSSILDRRWPANRMLSAERKAKLLAAMDSKTTKKGNPKASTNVPSEVRTALTAPVPAKPVFGRPDICWAISDDPTPKVRKELAYTLRRDQGGVQVVVAYEIEGQWIVRKITSEEAEALQGFPRGWTLVAGVTDGDRRRMMGNSIAVPVLRAIGKRIKAALDAHKASLAPLFATMPRSGVPAKVVDENGAPLPKPEARAARNRRHRETTKAKLLAAGVKLRKQNGQPSPEVADLDLTPEELGRLRRLRWRAKNGPESGRDKARKQMEAILQQKRQ